MGAKEDFDNLMGIASRAFGDAADQVDDFVKSGMESLGYKPRIEWDDPEPEQPQQQERRGPSFGARTGGQGGQQQQQQSSGAARQRQVGGGQQREYGG